MGLSGKLAWELGSPELLVVRSPWMLGYMVGGEGLPVDGKTVGKRRVVPLEGDFAW